MQSIDLRHFHFIHTPMYQRYSYMFLTITATTCDSTPNQQNIGC